MVHSVYAAIFIDAIHVKVRDGQVAIVRSTPRSGSTGEAAGTSWVCVPAPVGGWGVGQVPDGCADPEGLTTRCRWERFIVVLSQHGRCSWRQPFPGGSGMGRSSPDKAGTGQSCQRVWAWRAPRRGVTCGGVRWSV